MTLLPTLPLIFLLAGTDADTGWELATKDEGISIYGRERKDSGVREMKAVGLIDGAPMDVWAALRDYDHYVQTMPYTEEAKILKKEDDGKVLWFYSVINAPLVDRRDYVIRILDESDWKDGAGYLKVSWKATDELSPAERKGMVRVKINDGYWLLEPRENGTKTYATYYIYTDPGGSVPKWIANKGNTVAVPNVFRSIRKVIASKPKPKAP